MSFNFSQVGFFSSGRLQSGKRTPLEIGLLHRRRRRRGRVSGQTAVSVSVVQPVADAQPVHGLGVFKKRCRFLDSMTLKTFFSFVTDAGRGKFLRLGG
jgi:hypothetical protein